MNATEGCEPPLKRRHKKLTLVAENNVVCGLTHHQWFDLILQRLLLEDLIAVKRTCKTFAAFKRLLDRIKDKEYTAFDGFDKRFWNRRVEHSRSTIDERVYNNDIYHQGSEIMLEHEGKFILFSQHTQNNGDWMNFLGVYSNKRKLWEAFWHEKAMAYGSILYSFPFGYVKVDTRSKCMNKICIYMTGFTLDEMNTINKKDAY